MRALQFPLAFILFAVDILFTIFFFNLPWHADKYYSRHSFSVCILHSLCSVKTFLFTLLHVLSTAEQLQNNLINNIKRVAEDKGILCCAWKYAMEYCEISAGHVALWFIFRKCFITFIHSTLLSCLCLCAIDRDNMLFILHMYMMAHTHKHTRTPKWANTVCDCARQLSVTLWP